jgi:hypothetical protein
VTAWRLSCIDIGGIITAAHLCRSCDAHEDRRSRRATEAADGFRRAIQQIRELNGLTAAYLLVNAESGRVLTMTLWDNAAAMEASHVTASRLRTDAVRTVDGSILDIEEYEVAARELGDVA